jgi:hypothetical protein
MSYFNEGDFLEINKPCVQHWDWVLKMTRFCLMTIFTRLAGRKYVTGGTQLI